MDQIRPIGPIERDVEPVVRVTRLAPDAEREKPDQREGEPRRRPPEEPPPPPPDDENPPPLIDVRV
jgi:hypothetical protein